MATGDRQWEAQAKCGAEVAEALFVEGTVQKRVKSLCSDCPVCTECLAHGHAPSMRTRVDCSRCPARITGGPSEQCLLS
ncbi:WhiB family transcriptional regulator [Streptomyces olivaceoviridis]|uniref:WhiB family transcriptional regulator n=1 Tax=Streptomyces olivaceoviridis TaxID=1921 RepID=UPI0036863786